MSVIFEFEITFYLHMKAYFFSLFLLFFSTQSYAQIQLVTSEEALRPDQKVATTRAISRGPSIKLISNATVDAKSFQFKIALEPKGGSKIDSHSFKIEYLKQPPVELTERLKSAFSGGQLSIPVATLPKGLHAFKVSVKDSEGREGHSIISLEAK
jgi:hypothetical protein